VGRDRRQPQSAGARPGVDDHRAAPQAMCRGDAPRTRRRHGAGVEDIAAGHKVALARHSERRSGPQVRRSHRRCPGGHPGGRARPRATLGVGRWEEPASSPSPDAHPPHGAAPTRDHFLGYRRADGRAAPGTNRRGPTVNCSATVARMIALRADDRHKGNPASTASSRSARPRLWNGGGHSRGRHPAAHSAGLPRPCNVAAALLISLAAR